MPNKSEDIITLLTKLGFSDPQRLITANKNILNLSNQEINDRIYFIQNEYSGEDKITHIIEQDPRLLTLSETDTIDELKSLSINETQNIRTQKAKGPFDFGVKTVQKLDTEKRQCDYCNKITQQDLLYVNISPELFFNNFSAYRAIGFYVYQCGVCKYSSIFAYPLNPKMFIPYIGLIVGINPYFWQANIKLRKKYGSGGFTKYYPILPGGFYKIPQEQRRITVINPPKNLSDVKSITKAFLHIDEIIFICILLFILYIFVTALMSR